MLARNRFIYSARILITHDFTPTLQIGGRWVFKTSNVQGKGSAKNNLIEFAPEVAVDLIDLIEQNHRNSELFRGLLRLKIG
jgi:hypothetical protein